MAIKNIIAKGIGFSPGSVKFIPTHGFLAAAGGGGGTQLYIRRILGNRKDGMDDYQVSYQA